MELTFAVELRIGAAATEVLHLLRYLGEPIGNIVNRQKLVSLRGDEEFNVDEGPRELARVLPTQRFNRVEVRYEDATLPLHIFGGELTRLNSSS